MRNTLRLSALAVLATTSIIAQADPTLLLSAQVLLGHGRGNIQSLLSDDNDFYRIDSNESRTAFGCVAFTTSAPSQVQSLRIRLLGRRTGFGQVHLSMFNRVTQHWELAATTSRPSGSKAETRVTLHNGPSRYIQSDGRIFLRVSCECVILVVDRLKIEVNP
jgi:hypothetical protein